MADQRTQLSEIEDVLRATEEERAKSEAMLEALEDLRGSLGETEPLASILVGWPPEPTLRRPRDDLTAYVVTPGLLHRLRGKTDLDRESTGSDSERRSHCEYDVVRITPFSRYSLYVSKTTDGDKSLMLTRRWSFELDEETVVLESTVQSDEEDPRGLTEFARALARQVSQTEREDT